MDKSRPIGRGLEKRRALREPWFLHRKEGRDRFGARPGKLRGARPLGFSLKNQKANSRRAFYPDRVEDLERSESFGELLCAAVAVEHPIVERGLGDESAIYGLRTHRGESRRKDRPGERSPPPFQPGVQVEPVAS